MKKVVKAVGVGLVGAAVASAIVYAVKKIKEVDSFDEDFLEESDDDFSDEDDFMSEDDFSSNFPSSNITDEEFLERIGINKEDCIQAIYDAEEMYTKEELEEMSGTDLIDVYEALINGKYDDSNSSDNNESLDPFKLINEATREEVISILLDGNKDNSNFEYTEESLKALTDGELTQVYADYKVSIK